MIIPLLVELSIATTQPQIALFDELAPLYPDTDIATGSSTIEFAAARGTIAGVHLILSGCTPEQPIKLSPVDRGQWYQLLAVPVEENTGLHSRTERFDGKVNPYVIRRAPFEIYEVLKPIGNSFIPEDENIALRYELEIPVDSTTGLHKVTLTTSQGDQHLLATLLLNIYSAVVPPSGRYSLPYTNWFNLQNMATKHHVEPESNAHWELVDQYADMMKRGRQNTFMIHWSQFFSVIGRGSDYEI